jgi:hypothetical protein
MFEVVVLDGEVLTPAEAVAPGLAALGPGGDVDTYRLDPLST